MRRALPGAVLLLATACVYFNAMYDAEREYDVAVERRRAGNEGDARVRFDSVIAKAERIVARHPDSKYAAPAALLKARSEIAREKWQSAAATAAAVSALTDEPRLLGLAAGLEGVARRHLGDIEAAESLLTQGLESDPSSEDRAQFYFHRGLARLEGGQAAPAAEDLAAASRQGQLRREVRLDLARGLSEVGRYEEAGRLTAELVRENRFANFTPGMDAHLDSLVRRAPGVLVAAFGEELSEPDLTMTKRAALHYYRGLGREVGGDPEGALAAYDSARLGTEGRYANEAGYRSARLRIMSAERPIDVAGTRRALTAARSVPEPLVAADAERLGTAVDEFTSLVQAYQTRGSTAAEAALRAAEIAGSELGARHVARGLYLRYLELAPDSPWRAKAIAGAMLHSDWPAGEWASDRGPETDARLRTLLVNLPATDPYRVSIQDLPRDAQVDSAYVEAERDLRRRLIQIRMLYDTTAVLVAPTDTLPADSAEDEEDRPQDQPDVEF